MKTAVAAKYCEPCKPLVRLAHEAKRNSDPEKKAKRLQRTLERRRENPEPYKAAYQRWLAQPESRRKVAERGKLWREANPERAKAISKRGAQSQRALDYRRSERAKALRKRRHAERMADPGYRLEGRISAGIRHGLKANKAGAKWEALVGYTLDDLRAHLERQFAKGMGWHNMGEWHLDHIIPRASFNYSSPEDPEFKACWALTNLRPLWKGENQAKHAKRLHLI